MRLSDEGLRQKMSETASQLMTDVGERRLFRWTAQLIDLALEPDKAEAAIGDLLEGCRRRYIVDRGHAMRWLCVQTGWVLFNRGLDVVRRLSAARAGK